MKKHPVDDLFTRKLTDWQPEVTNQLWDRIEARQGKVPRRLGWYWYAAASVTILVLAGYVVWQSEGGGSTGDKRGVATEEQMKQRARPEQLPEIVPSEKTIVLASSDEARKSTSQKPITTQNRRVMNTGEVVMVKTNEPVVLPERMEVAAIQRKHTAPESLIAENEEGHSLTPTAVQPGIVGNSFHDTATGRVVVAHIELAPLKEDESKNSKFIRVLRQLKNAKQGEAIEWDEVGFNPKKLMARADERLKNEEEKISKKYQELKDKTNL